MLQTRRRDFIGGLTLTAAAMAWPGLLRAGEAPWKPRLALSSVMFSDLSLEEFCAKAVALGFPQIDLWGPFGKCRHLEEAVGMGPEKFMELLKRHGLEVGAWTLYMGKDKRRRFPDYAEFIGACGGGIVVSGTQYEGTAKAKLEGSIIGFYERIAPEIALARKHGVKLAIENHGWAILDSPESFDLFARHNPAPDICGFAVAPYHLQRIKADVAALIRKHGRQLLFFYAWQAGEGTAQLPGEGPVDFAPWLQALREVNFTHSMTPFMHGELPVEDMSAAVAKSTSYLNQLKLES